MKVKTRYTLFTVLLALGLMIFLLGSRQIIKTYQRENILMETVTIGRSLTDEHEQLEKQRGLKNGMFDVLIQVAGISVIIGSCVILTKRT